MRGEKTLHPAVATVAAPRTATVAVEAATRVAKIVSAQSPPPSHT